MVNRTIVRSKVIQMLFACMDSEEISIHAARKALLQSFSDTYCLYFVMLDFVNGLTDYAEAQIQDQIARAQITHRNVEPNRRFVNNAFARQLFENRRHRAFMHDQHLSWDAGQEAFATVYKQLQETDYFQQYMSAPDCTYEDDKNIWRKIFTCLIPGNEAVLSALDEMEIVLDHQGWTTDMDVVISYVIKTIRRFDPEAGSDQTLMEMFDTEQELQFGPDLLQDAIENKDVYQQLINDHLKNWDPSRIAKMDKVILIAALAEISHFPDLAVEVSMNEYIELDKEYSGDKNYLFINGILNETLKDLRAKNLLFKPLR